MRKVSPTLIEMYHNIKVGDIVRRRHSKDLYQVSKKRSWNEILHQNRSSQDITHYSIYVKPFKVNTNSDRPFLRRRHMPWNLYRFAELYIKLGKKRQATMKVLFG